ncbi:MAG: 3-isopropylmalate dehydratase small subunit [Proteobacteria bacterium]|nr:3-isopropylmalate dehydratase small subunit [Pseudomonadota bacterium]
MTEKSRNSAAVIHSHTYNIPLDNIDTDQIIPAQFLTTTEREGLGKFCFYGWRFNADGTAKENNPLHDHRPDRQQVLVTGSNFGCGSSREHAPWALLDYGIRAVISSRFADIFCNNSLTNGLIPVTAEEHVIEYLLKHPDSIVSIDIDTQQLTIRDYGTFDFPLDSFSVFCLTHDIDQLDFILQNEQEISAHEKRYGK